MKLSGNVAVMQQASMILSKLGKELERAEHSIRTAKGHQMLSLISQTRARRREESSLKNLQISFSVLEEPHQEQEKPPLHPCLISL